jgi:hypothetical protein
VSAKRTAIRRIALACLLCFAVVFLLSSAFVCANANHRHDHNGLKGSCATCAQVAAKLDLLRALQAFVRLTGYALAGPVALVLAVGAALPGTRPGTPVALNIRMNN